MKTKCRVKFANGDTETMLVRGIAKIGDRVRLCSSDAVATIIEILEIITGFDAKEIVTGLHS